MYFEQMQFLFYCLKSQYTRSCLLIKMNTLENI